MHPNRRRKKRPNYGLKTVEIQRGPSGFGFTISGQQPCILSCIVSKSPAEQAGLRAGDFLISVNGISVSKMAHDAVVGLIGNCVGPIQMTIAENYYSDSSDEEVNCRIGRKPKLRQPRRLKGVKSSSIGANSGSLKENNGAPIEYKALIGYLGTIEMPKPLLPNSRHQTLCNWIRKLRQEKRVPTLVLMTILPTCLTLKNSSNHIIAIYPTNRIVYVSTSDKDTKYFGLVTSANNKDTNISNSCHIFAINAQLIEHNEHFNEAKTFKILCTRDPIGNFCFEFPQNGLYIVNLIQTMFNLQKIEANSPQPSASSNSDSGIGYRDDCGLNISDRILVVEFPTTYRPLPVVNNTNNRPQGIDRVLNLTKNQFPIKENNKFKYGNVDSGQVYSESPIDVPQSDLSCIATEFRVPFVPKLPHNSQEFSKSDTKLNYCGSLQELSDSWDKNWMGKKNITAQSEPDVRIQQNLCDQNAAGGRCALGGATAGKGGADGAISWGTSFEKLLDDPVGLYAFAEFLKKEVSAENIYFWTACERYKSLKSPSERTTEAQRIFKEHLESGASDAVNVDAQGRQAAEQGLLEGAGADIFDMAQKQIFNLMKFDSYPRFLKSPLYKRCLGGEFTSSFDARLSLHNTSAQFTPSKLKKSFSNAEDRRRKSLLPWHRKTTSGVSSDNQRPKSRDRSDIPVGKSWDGVLTVPSSEDRRDIHSSHSSLTSLDLAASQDIRQEESRSALCRVLLSNGSTTVVQIKDGETINQLINRLLEKRGLTYTSYEVFTNKHPKALDINDSSTKVSGCEVTIEQRVVFKLDLPNKKIISVKSKYTKLIIDVLRPILHKYKFTLDQVNITRAGYFVDIALPVTTIDNARLQIHLKDDVTNPQTKVKISKLEEITNDLFEGILQDKSDGQVFKPTSSVKSEDWGSEHSSGLLTKFLRRDSALHQEKKKKVPVKLATNDAKEEGGGDKKPLIAKLKAGANKLHVGTCSESDELVEGLTRAQRRLEDQRGTEINFELPDFLKDDQEKRPLGQNVNVLTKKKGLEPPPLPPKPKIVPIKPLNWGAGFYKADKETFLEQPSSSFV
ncbi:unnamed protein product [Ceutorhynchus assimilis]|uniref:Regulator of G-protein signaling loco n=1 Tax=Ceutorhynchus assimilis TaxID=467358 RepID=A0A9P0GPX8_9CUCU|nr:unnamed protein product [Ceutorhynchus assimilis]